MPQQGCLNIKKSRILWAGGVLAGLMVAGGAFSEGALAQTTGAPAADTTPAAQSAVQATASQATTADTTTDTPSADIAASQASPQAAGPWMADLSSGYSGRDSGPGGAFAVVGLSRQLGSFYVRGAFTHYRSTFERSDTALPSTFSIGSIGMGGNLHNWVFDAWASYGWQTYGQVSTDGSLRESNTARGSPYVALGGDFGHVFTLASNWYLTPTVTASYTHSRLLRPGYTIYGERDFETSEPTWTGATALRLDHKLGARGQNYIGIAASYHLTSNGLSVVEPGTIADFYLPRTVHYADGWEEFAVNGSVQLSRRLWLDGNVTRSLGVRVGDSTTASAGIRVNF